jgi:oligopeptide/dipeptide ABC transporter ATP-binding protein
MRDFRRRAQIVFQDPYGSLNPRMKIGEMLEEPLLVHGIGAKREAGARARDLLRVVGLPADSYNRYPHEFSGGQRQRAGIARALVLEPELIVADEAVSALDVSIRAQIINLLIRLQTEFGLTYIFIAHDLSLVRYVSDRVAVMYLGQVFELAPTHALYASPLHPYTEALLSAIPVPDPVVEQTRERIILTGDVPSPARPPAGCRFHTRCWLRRALDDPARCVDEQPALRQLETGHWTACHFAEALREMRVGSPVA